MTNRREFLSSAAAVGTIAIVGRSFPSAVMHSNEATMLFDGALAQRSVEAKITLYNYGKKVMAVDVLLDEELLVDSVRYGKGADIVIQAKEDFEFNKATVQVEGIPKELDLQIPDRHFVAAGNTLTLTSTEHGFLHAQL